jgi:hypothetical protein
MAKADDERVTTGTPEPLEARSEEDVTPGSILRELVFNQYQAIVAGGAALASIVTLNPLPVLIWLGSELVLLPILDSGPLRRLVHRRRAAIAQAKARDDRARAKSALTPASAKRYAAMEHLCGLIETNYQSLTGISQAYLAEQRGKLDAILQGCLHRLTALQRYERLPADRNPRAIEEEIADLEHELEREDLSERAAAALRKNLELKRRLLASVSQMRDTVRTLLTELDSMEALLEVLHQNSISLRDPQAISEELDAIVRQSEESERVVREMEALLRPEGSTAAAWPEATSAAGRGPGRGRTGGRGR